MRTYSNNDILLRKGMTNGLIFFYQRWQELLDHRTQDMHQYKLLNSFIVTTELYDIIDKMLNGFILTYHNIKDIKDEALEILKEDYVLGMNKPLCGMLLKIVGDIKEKSNSDDAIHLKSLKYRLEAPMKQLQSFYKCNIIKELKNDVQNNNFNKNMIEKHTMMLISQCLYEKWSAQGLFSLSHIFTRRRPFDDNWKDFESKITSPLNHFELFYNFNIFSGNRSYDSSFIQTINGLGIDLIKGEAIANRATSMPITHINSNKYYVRLSLDATDTKSAALQGLSQLSQKLHVASFYNILNPVAVANTDVVIYSPDENRAEPLQLATLFETHDYLDSSTSVYESTKKIIDDTSKSDINNALRAAFTYTNLSRAADFQETKFILLWIALESLMRTGLYDDIISHVKRVLPACLCRKYIYRLIRNFSEDCVRCGIEQINSLNLDMKTYNKQELVTKIITVMRNPTDNIILLDQCTVNDLLHYRCSEIMSLMQDNEKIISKITRHKRRIEWHIQRLYRIRNEITHAAFSSEKTLAIYIQQLYNYLSQLISEIVFYIEHKKATSIEEVFSSMENNYDIFISLYKDNYFSMPTSMLQNGIIDFC